MRRCKSQHRKFWGLGTAWLWCYECGAIRQVAPHIDTNWTYPVGADGENPALADMPRLTTE